MPRSSTWLFPLGFPTRILYAFLISPMRATWTRPSHTWLHHSNSPLVLQNEETNFRVKQGQAGILARFILCRHIFMRST
jgi:hypothetical protein